MKLLLLCLCSILAANAHAQRRAVMENLAATNSAIFIGTASPAGYVTVGGSVTVKGAGGLGVTYGITAATMTTTAGANFATTSGNVGIGTASPASSLDVRGTIRSGTFANPPSGSGSSIEMGVDGVPQGIVQVYDRTGGVYLPLSVDALYHYFRVSGTEKMRIDASGYVGIGTSSPSTKLHLSSGTITIDGTGSPSAGGALCLNTSKAISKCTSAVDASGNCTCP